MAPKQTNKSKPEVEPTVPEEAPEEKLGVLGDGREPQVEGEAKTGFDDRTQELQPWAGTNGVDDTRPEPTIVKQKEEKE